MVAVVEVSIVRVIVIGRDQRVNVDDLGGLVKLACDFSSTFRGHSILLCCIWCILTDLTEHFYSIDSISARSAKTCGVDRGASRHF